MIRNAVTILWALLLWASISTSFGATFNRGPFLQNASTNAMLISWRTPAPASTFVAYGETPALGLLVTNAAMETNHVAVLTNLAPDTVYYYRAGSTDAGGTVQSDTNSFRTFKPSGPVRFQVVGDSPGLASGFASPDAINVAAAMRNESTDLVLHLGDLTYYGYLDIEFFNVFQPQMKAVPYFLVIGNHDVSSADTTGRVFQESFYLPTNSATGTEQFYSFDNGDVHFVGLFNPWFQTYVFTADTLQYRWLTNDLAQTSKRWNVIFLHFPVATSALHASDDYNGNGIPDHVEMMRLLAPVAERYGVQAIFGSHDHDYERFAPTNGFHYVISGGGGRGPLYSLNTQHPASLQFWKSYEFMRVNVSNETMLVEAVNTNGTVFDSFAITLSPPPSPTVWPAAWNTPVVETAPANDSDGNINGQTFDLIGAPIPAVTGKYSNLGRVYVNNDATHLYVGFQEAAFYRGHNIFLFIESPRQPGVTSMAGLGNGLVDPAGQGADGLDFLENLSFNNFAPSIGCILGDEYADGQYRSFTRANLGLNIGQGVFYLDENFTDVPGIRLQQYNRSPQTNDSPMTQTGINTEQNADYIELAIPFSALSNVAPGDVLKIGAVVAGTGYNLLNQTRELDAGFLGTSLSGSGQDSIVLSGLRVRLAGDPANPDWDGDGLPNEWEQAHGLNAFSAAGEDGASGDPDHDGMSNLSEYLAGTDPQDALSRLKITLLVNESGPVRLAWSAVIGRRYHIQRSVGSLSNFVDLDEPSLPRQATTTQESYELATAGAVGAEQVFYRIRLVP